jgi:hypothetical protein
LGALLQQHGAQRGKFEILKVKMGYDIIGDIHGHADQLEALLSKLGYQHRGGAWRHPARTAIFVGDLIDRGPGQLRTLRTVRAMIDAGTARAVMGNHEFNAIAWATPDPETPGAHLRERRGAKGEKNRAQHRAFLEEVGPDSPEHADWVDWFLDLPLWLEEPNFRVVHACWSPRHVELVAPHLREGARPTRDLITAASRRGSEFYRAVETLLKGAEIKLPDGYTFTDKDGHVRREIRTKWWDPTQTTYRSTYMGPKGVDIPDIAIDGMDLTPTPDRPTFIGHYWFDPIGPVAPASPLVACVDYSVARGGPLVAYRFDGEPQLTAANFVSVRA